MCMCMPIDRYCRNLIAIGPSKNVNKNKTSLHDIRSYQNGYN